MFEKLIKFLTKIHAKQKAASGEEYLKSDYYLASQMRNLHKNGAYVLIKFDGYWRASQLKADGEEWGTYGMTYEKAMASLLDCIDKNLFSDIGKDA